MANLGTLSNSRTLGLFSIWAIGVGLVISGESFGWNNGWALLGPVGFMIPVAIITIMYFFLSNVLIELACVYPNSEGPHTYAKLAFGQIFSDFVAIAILIEFLFATPAIANAVGQYLHFLSPEIFDKKITSIALIIIFCVINLFRINVTAKFMVVLTILAIVELFVFFTSVSLEINPDNFTYSSFDNYSFNNILKAMPYAIWLFLGLEGISLLSKNIRKKNYKTYITKGYMYGFFTLAILSLIVLFFAGSAYNWTESTWMSMVNMNDHPLPHVMKLTLGVNNPYVQIFAFIGLGGLIASLQGITLASINQINFLISPLLNDNNTKKMTTSFIVIIIGVLSIWYETTDFLIEVSVFGAVCLYLTSCISLLKLRKMTNKNEIVNNDIQKIDGEIIASHIEYKSLKSTTSSIIVIVISLFCIGSLVSQHSKYFLVFIAITMSYIIINNLNNKNGK